MPAKKFNLWAEIGQTGVSENAGILSDRYAETLRGQAGILKMARVLRREPSAFTSWNMVLLAAAAARWTVNPAADNKADQDCADFVQSCLDDCSHSWPDAVRFAMSAWPFGFSDHEIVWKKRLGQNPGRDLPTSKWDDGLVGLRKLAKRRQETIYQWVNDEHGGKQAMIQQDPNTGKNLEPCPIEKLLHYIGGDERGSWEGLGWLETAYWLAYLIEQLEQIGGATAQRAGTGLPVFKFLSPPDTTTQSTVDEIGEGLTSSELQYVKLPGPMVEFDLKTVSMSNLGDIRGWIDQLRWEIAALVAATFVRLGSTERGTQSLGGTMYDAFTLGIDGCLDVVTDVWNRYLIPRLIANNPGEFKSISDHPRITHSKITVLPPATAQWLKNVSEFMDGADPADVEWVRGFMGMPYKSAKDIAAAQEEAAKEAEAAQKKAEALAAKQAEQPPQQPQPEQEAVPVKPAEQPATAEGQKAEGGVKQPETGKQSGETQASEMEFFNTAHEPAGSPIGGQFAHAADKGAGSGGGFPTSVTGADGKSYYPLGQTSGGTLVYPTDSVIGLDVGNGFKVSAAKVTFGGWNIDLEKDAATLTIGKMKPITRGSGSYLFLQHPDGHETKFSGMGDLEEKLTKLLAKQYGIQYAKLPKPITLTDDNGLRTYGVTVKGEADVEASYYPAAVREALLTAALRIVAGRETESDVELAAKLLPDA